MSSQFPPKRSLQERVKRVFRVGHQTRVEQDVRCPMHSTISANRFCSARGGNGIGIFFTSVRLMPRTAAPLVTMPTTFALRPSEGIRARRLARHHISPAVPCPA